MSRVFVTGASGFIGGHIAETLARAGHQVSAMARSERSAEVVRGWGAEPVMCELGRVSASHLEGVDSIVHAAARAEDWGSREQFFEANVAGTRQLLEVAQLAGVRRFIHIGTEAMLFDGGDLWFVDERHQPPSRHRFPYSESKAEAERQVLAANRQGFTTLSLRPRLVWGPRDQSVLPTLLDMVQQGAFMWVDGGRSHTSTTHVANLVHAVSLALEGGQGGDAYFIADGEIDTVRGFVSRLVATAGVELTDRSIPSALARPLARTIEAVFARALPGRRPPMTEFAIAMLAASITVNTRKAREQLGYEPVISVAEGLAQMSPE